MKLFYLFRLFIFVIGCYSTQRDCLSFQTGQFEFTSIVGGDTLTTHFVRSKEIEVDYYAGIADSSYVKWVNDCECILRKIAPKNFQDTKPIQMKILSTKANTYMFEYSIVGDEGNKQRGMVTKIKD